jgi:hypothetical protein
VWGQIARTHAFQEALLKPDGQVHLGRQQEQGVDQPLKMAQLGPTVRARSDMTQ